MTKHSTAAQLPGSPSLLRNKVIWLRQPSRFSFFANFPRQTGGALSLSRHFPSQVMLITHSNKLTTKQPKEECSS